MGLYIHPAEKVEQEGRPITIGTSLHHMQSQLIGEEQAVAVAARIHGKVALLIKNDNDYDAVKRSGGDLYAISAELAATAR